MTSRQGSSRNPQDSSKYTGSARSANSNASRTPPDNSSRILPSLSDLMKVSMGLQRDGSSGTDDELESIKFDQSDLDEFFKSRSRPSTGNHAAQTPESWSQTLPARLCPDDSRTVSSPNTTNSSAKSSAASPYSRSSASSAPPHRASKHGAKTPAKKGSKTDGGSASRPVVSWR